MASNRGETYRRERAESELFQRQMRGLVERAIEQGLVAAALIEGDGTVVAGAGAITRDELLPIVAFVLERSEGDDIGSRLLAGEIISCTLDARDIAVGIAARQIIVVAVLKVDELPQLLGLTSPEQLALVEALRDDVARIVVARNSQGAAPPPPNATGGSGSGPADLQLVEFGITVRRDRGKA